MKAAFHPCVGLLAALVLGGCGRIGVRNAPSGARVGGPGQSGEITVVMTGFRNDNGSARIAIFNSADSFPSDRDSAFRLALAQIQNHEARVVLPDVPSGRYAVSVFHDEDDDDRMRTTFLGSPIGGYGISNNPDCRFSPPSFRDAEFELDSDRVTIRITIRYR